MSREQELAALKIQADYLRQGFEDIASRIAALEAPDSETSDGSLGGGTDI